MVSRRQKRRESTNRLGNVVHDDGSLRVPVVHGREGAEALLSGSVPNLELDDLVLCFVVEKKVSQAARKREKWGRRPSRNGSLAGSFEV